MDPQQKRLLVRAAAGIHQGLVSRRRQDEIKLPEDNWADALNVFNQIGKARERGWHRAAEQLREDLVWPIDSCRARLATLVEELNKRADASPLPTESELLRDLLALETEFEEVSCDLEEHEVWVTTTAVELEGLYLGRFEIRLDWNRLHEGKFYRIVAVDPNPAAKADAVTHPHVRDETLCAGEGWEAIKAALDTGRIGDFFLIVAQILNTYAKGSAFVELDGWDEESEETCSCDSCGYDIHPDDSYSCENCGTCLCCDCSYYCDHCDSRFCDQCMSACRVCEEDFCSGCLKSCERCKQLVCKTCLSEQGLCKTCLEEQQSTENQDAHLPESTYQPAATAAAPRFSPTAWAKLLFLRDRGTTEVGGFGVSRPDDLLYVEDVQTVKQVCNVVNVQFDDEAVAQFFDAQVDAGRQPCQFARIWIHTHPEMSAQPSGTDEETLGRVFGKAEWAVMFILSKTDDVYCRLRFNVGPGGEQEIPVEVDYGRQFAGTDFAAWDAEYLANVVDADGFGLGRWGDTTLAMLEMKPGQATEAVSTRIARAADTLAAMAWDQAAVTEAVQSGHLTVEDLIEMAEGSWSDAVSGSDDDLREYLHIQWGWADADIDEQLRLGWTLLELVQMADSEQGFDGWLDPREERCALTDL